jgi:hypothetical protein
MDALDKMEFELYPVIENDVTPFVKKFYAFKTIYTSMVNSLDNEDIVTMISDSLRIFFDRFEKFINSSGRIENENSLKQ